MEWLNYHHLLYFWMVVREGTVARAADRLGLTQQTVSGQIRVLEESFGEKLFVRAGRRLQPSEIGKVVYQYADEIFSLGQELRDTLKGRPTGRSLRLQVGVADVLPKLVAYRLLEPVLAMPQPVQLVVREARPEELLSRLAVHELDIVLTDAPLPPALKMRAFQHLIGESEVQIFGATKLATKYRRGFPQSLQGAPFLLPAEHTALRLSLNAWFHRHGIRPRIVGEFEDTALVKTFGEAGVGLFAAPAAVAEPIRRQYRTPLVGTLTGAVERFYALTLERRITHPAVAVITRSARQALLPRPRK